MTKNELIFFTKEGRFGEGTGSTVQDVITAGADGSKLLDLRVTATGGTTDIRIQVNGIDVATFTAPAIGTQLMNPEPIDKNGNKYYNLPASSVVRMVPVGGGSVTVMAYVEDY